MSLFTVEIETLVLDGFDLSPSAGRRLARLTEEALQRLLDQRGVPSPLSRLEVKEAPEQQMNATPDVKHERLAGDLAEALYRALDRMS
jgi:hypothetical protein